MWGYPVLLFFSHLYVTTSQSIIESYRNARSVLWKPGCSKKLRRFRSKWRDPNSPMEWKTFAGSALSLLPPSWRPPCSPHHMLQPRHSSLIPWKVSGWSSFNRLSARSSTWRLRFRKALAGSWLSAFFLRQSFPCSVNCIPCNRSEQTAVMSEIEFALRSSDSTLKLSKTPAGSLVKLLLRRSSMFKDKFRKHPGGRSLSKLLCSRRCFKLSSRSKTPTGREPGNKILDYWIVVKFWNRAITVLSIYSKLRWRHAFKPPNNFNKLGNPQKFEDVTKLVKAHETKFWMNSINTISLYKAWNLDFFCLFRTSSLYKNLKPKFEWSLSTTYFSPR